MRPSSRVTMADAAKRRIGGRPPPPARAPIRPPPGEDPGSRAPVSVERHAACIVRRHRPEPSHAISARSRAGRSSSPWSGACGPRGALPDGSPARSPLHVGHAGEARGRHSPRSGSKPGVAAPVMQPAMSPVASRPCPGQALRLASQASSVRRLLASRSRSSASSTLVASIAHRNRRRPSPAHAPRRGRSDALQRAPDIQRRASAAPPGPHRQCTSSRMFFIAGALLLLGLMITFSVARV